MAGYQPLKIVGNSTGLVQERENFLLPDDAYPRLQNAYVWRERIKRKKGCQLLGRLQRSLTTASLSGQFAAGGAGVLEYSLPNNLGITATEPNSSFVPGNLTTMVIAIGAPISQTLTDTLGTGVFTITGAGPITSASINYSTGHLFITFSGAAGGSTGTFTGGYYPGLPVMGIRIRELTNSANDQTIVWDQKYAYFYNSTTNAYQEFIPGTTWNAHNADTTGTDFFWTTNYWTGGLNTPFLASAGKKLFWETNNTGQFGVNQDPPRITDGTTWVDFTSSTWHQIDATNFLLNWLCMLPFRGRMVVFNTYEGINTTSNINYSNRIRWSTIGNPFIPYSAGPPAKGSWRDDIRGQGGFLDIPTSEDIVSIGFVRDNLVIYCERSTWQLRYTGRSIAPFQIEKVNSENGSQGPFASIQFDTSLVTIGDKGIIECDSYKAERIDIKIPDYVFQGQSKNNGPFRTQGVRDFINRFAYWSLSVVSPNTINTIFPNQRLVYNYENDSWALFDDTYTALGTYQPQKNRTWLNTKLPWILCNFPWIDQQSSTPQIIGGNQQGFVELLNQTTANDVSLYISAITSHTTTPTVITSINHNLITGTIIGISGIPSGTPFSNLNGGVYSIIFVDINSFQLMLYSTVTGQFSTPQLDTATGYIGIGYINIRDNFSILSKKFNFLDEGQSIQIGYLDILMEASEATNPGAISLNVYINYDDTNPTNILPNNSIDNGDEPNTMDTFFNSIIPTTPSNLAAAKAGTKFWQRVFCPTRANFLTLEYKLSNAQMNGIEQEQDVQIDAQVLWIRKSGRLSQF